jgi:hypothetical protein
METSQPLKYSLPQDSLNEPVQKDLLEFTLYPKVSRDSITSSAYSFGTIKSSPNTRTCPRKDLISLLDKRRLCALPIAMKMIVVKTIASIAKVSAEPIDANLEREIIP